MRSPADNDPISDLSGHMHHLGWLTQERDRGGGGVATTAGGAPGGRDCLSLSAFSLSGTQRVYRYRLQRILNFTVPLVFLILTERCKATRLTQDAVSLLSNEWVTCGVSIIVGRENRGVLITQQIISTLSIAAITHCASSITEASHLPLPAPVSHRSHLTLFPLPFPDRSDPRLLPRPCDGQSRGTS